MNPITQQTPDIGVITSLRGLHWLTGEISEIPYLRMSGNVIVPTNLSEIGDQPTRTALGNRESNMESILWITITIWNGMNGREFFY